MVAARFVTVSEGWGMPLVRLREVTMQARGRVFAKFIHVL